MRGYRNFLIVFGVLFIVYVAAQLNKPEPTSWRISLSKEDKNPFGSYILFRQLKDLFPAATVQSYRMPVYNQLNNINSYNSAYIIVSPELAFTKEDFKEINNYVEEGNYVFISSEYMDKSFSDTLGFKTKFASIFGEKDSTSVNFVNPALKSATNYTFRKSGIDQYFSEIDTAKTIVLGVNNHSDPNFIQIPHGDGAYFIHAAPLCFSNYFMLFKNNAEYTAKVLSYLPKDVDRVYWDEYYKLGPSGAKSPLRFFLTNDTLLWALRLSIIGLILFVLFDMKRRQRIIPVITPLRNSTLDFVKTIANLYFNQKDNGSIAHKKISYFLEFVRQRFYLPTQVLDESFVQQLSRKSGVIKEDVEQLVRVLKEIESGYPVSDPLLLMVNQHIDNFYKQAK